MHTLFLSLAEGVLKDNNPHCLSELAKYLNQFSNIQLIFTLDHPPQNLLFTCCEILSKKILNGKSIASESTDPNNTLHFITQKLTAILTSNAYSNHVGRSVLNLLILSLKEGITGRNQLHGLLICLKQFFPTLNYSPQLNPSEFHFGRKQHIQDENKFNIGVQILSGIMQYVTDPNFQTKYYTYRINLEMFKNHYLPLYVHITAIYGYQILSNLSQHGNIASKYINMFRGLMMFPFTLQTQIFAQEKLQIQETFLPQFFRLIVCDLQFIKLVFNAYLWLNKNQQLMEIIGRIILTNSFIFGSQPQRVKCRQLFSQMASLLMQYTTNDPLSISYVISIQSYVINHYSQSELFLGNKKNYLLNVVQFISMVVRNSQIRVENGQNNPISQAFQLLHQQSPCIIGDYVDQIVFMFCIRLVELKGNIDWSVQEQQNQFYQFYKPLISIAENRKTIFWYIFDQIQVQYLQQKSRIFWMYFACFLLPTSKANENETKIIFKFLSHALKHKKLCSLSYVNKIITPLLSKINKNQPITEIWLNAKLIFNVDINSFLDCIVSYTLEVMTDADYANLIQNSIQIINEILIKFTNSLLIDRLILNLNRTLLNEPKFYQCRIELMEMIASCWLRQKYQKIVKMYKWISIPSQPSLLQFAQHLNDLTGVIKAINNKNILKTFIQLALPNLNELFALFLSERSIHTSFSHQYFFQSYQQFVHFLLTCMKINLSTSTHSNLQLQIAELLAYSLEKNIEYDYDQILIEIWQNFVDLNSLAPLLPLHIDMRLKNEKQYHVLLLMYIENLSRVSSQDSLCQLYPFIKQNLTFLKQWWIQIIERGLHPKINVKSLVKESQFDGEQITELGRLIFRIGQYDSSYWKITNTEVQFIENFKHQYKNKNI